MELSKSELLRARLVWLALALCGPTYCIFTGFIVVVIEGDSLLQWQGLADAEPPVSLGMMIAVCAPLTIFWVLLCRQIIFSVLVHRPDPLSDEPAEPPGFQAWLRPWLVFAGLAELPLTGALVWCMLFGMLPLLWVVAAETLAVMLVYMPRSESLEDAG